MHPDAVCPHLIEVKTANGCELGGFAAIPFTASLDAVIDLVEGELPKWNIQLWKFNAGPEQGGRAVLSRLPIFHGYASAGHTLPAVALLLALLEVRGD